MAASFFKIALAGLLFFLRSTHATIEGETFASIDHETFDSMDYEIRALVSNSGSFSGSQSVRTCGDHSIVGVISEEGDICCNISCTQCGGDGCGSAGWGCCREFIMENRPYCGGGVQGPCKLGGCGKGIEGTPSDEAILSDGSSVCCSSDCTQCGGSGCSDAGTDCCIDAIISELQECGGDNDNQAPCIID